ncbi:unnamed protein product [Colias eurytheme]|nr:unnamed protein product [Colias eurytheme]
MGTVNSNPLLDLISGIVAKPTAEDVECHAPKPILLATGRANFPIPWHPHTISISLIMLGNFAIAGVPGEPTTMAGRRIKEVVGSVMEDRGYRGRVVVGGLTNEYIHYVTTFEEYQIQRYEAASVIYGPNTLDIFLNKFREFTAVAIEGGNVPPGPEPLDSRDNTISLILPVVMDTAPFGTNFGDVLEQPPGTVSPGDVVSASFVAANPRNDLLQESSHAAVERLELGHWVLVASDADWNTKFKWKRESTILGTSTATFEWEIPQTSSPSNLPHRIVYRGTARSVSGRLRSFQGATRNFTIGYRINI